MFVKFVVLVFLQLLPEATPTPAASPPASPPPLLAVAPEFTLYDFRTNGVAPAQADVSNALANISINAGKLHGSATVGDYAFPVVGFALVPDTAPGANAMLYGPLPVAALTYRFDAHVSLAAGKFAALLGQESPFTYQNANVQRGLGWNMEPTISRGVQLAYVNGPWNAALQENDAYYSGRNRALEVLLGWSPSANTNLQFAAIVPGAGAPPNPTTGVGNKAEYDVMYTRAIGNLQLLPYVLWVHSPARASLGYTRSEDAYAAVLLGVWTFSPQWSAAFRYEDARNRSAASDLSLNADLVGFGPGSGAESQTVTPAYRFGNGGILRFEYSRVRAGAIAQTRYGLEFGVMH